MDHRLIVLGAALAAGLAIATPATSGELILEPAGTSRGATAAAKPATDAASSAGDASSGDLVDRVSELEARRAEIDHRNRSPISVEISGSVAAEVMRTK